MKHIAQISGLVVSNFTSAKLQTSQSIDIPASPEKIWTTIGNQAAAAQWLPSVKKLLSVDVSQADADGVGAERLVVYGSGDEIKETVVYAERNKVLAYQIAFPSMVKDHLSILEIKENGIASTTVRFYAYFTPTQFTGYLMKYGVYASIVKGALKNLSALCTQ